MNSVCCPDAPLKKAYPVCPDGVGEGLRATDLKGITCDDTVDYAKTIDQDNNACVGVAYMNSVCCPDAPLKDPCPVCPDKVSEGLGATDLDGTTFNGVVNYTKTINQDNDSCSDMMGMQRLCCPDAIKSAEHPCPVCLNGVGEGVGATDLNGEGLTFHDKNNLG